MVLDSLCAIVPDAFCLADFWYCWKWVEKQAVFQLPLFRIILGILLYRSGDVWCNMLQWSQFLHPRHRWEVGDSAARRCSGWMNIMCDVLGVSCSAQKFWLFTELTDYCPLESNHIVIAGWVRLTKCRYPIHGIFLWLFHAFPYNIQQPSPSIYVPIPGGQIPCSWWTLQARHQAQWRAARTSVDSWWQLKNSQVEREWKFLQR